MSLGALNVAWAYALIDALVKGGVREVQVAPGSRSTPLILAAHAHPDLAIRVHLDERSSAFFALGYGKASGRVTPVVTTSGTAVANLVPAAVEADASDVPMLFITADRPPRLRGADANQTIEQTVLLQPFSRFFRDLPVPSPDDLETPFQAGARGLAAALGHPAGPVHLNVPFDKPLEPDAPSTVSALVTEVANRFTNRSVDAHVTGLEPESGDALRAALTVAERPLLIAGPSTQDQSDGLALRAFAEEWRVPLLADPLSGARFTEEASGVVIASYDQVLRDPQLAEVLAPDMVIRTGRTSSSAGLQTALECWKQAEHWVVDDGSKWKDHQGLAKHYIRSRPSDLFPLITPAPTESLWPGWIRAWASLEAEAWGVIDDGGRIEDNEGGLAAVVVASMPKGATLFVSSSMPVRDIDSYGRPQGRPFRVLGNRGASGIDGIVSTVLGVAAGSPTGAPVVGLLGDLALYHDMNGLLAARYKDLNVILVVVDNDGGGIFHHLPIRAFEPAFTSYFATPHGLDFQHAATLYGIPFTDCADPGMLAETLERESEGSGVRLVRCRTNRDASMNAHRETTRRVHRRIRERELDQPFRRRLNDDA